MKTEEKKEAQSIATEAMLQVRKQLITMFGVALLSGLGMNYSFMSNINRNVEELRTTQREQQAKIDELTKVVYTQINGR